MGLLTDLRSFLQHVQSRRIALLPDLSAVDLRPMRAAAARSEHREDRVFLDQGEQLVTDLALGLQAEFGRDLPQELQALVEAGLAALVHQHLGQAVPSALRGVVEALDRVDQRLFERAVSAAFNGWWARSEARLQPHWRYAIELGLLRGSGGRLSLLPPGEVLLRLTGLDATRWLLALELLSSLDRDDPWRGHPQLAEELVSKRELVLHDHEAAISYSYGCARALDWPWENPALTRWQALGLLRAERFRDEVDGGERVALTDTGAELLRELLAEPDTPLKSLARATLEDTTSALMDLSPLAARGRASAGVIRHARMIAHELRNALIPVHYQYTRLWEQLPHDDLRVALHRRHTMILSGLERALRFVRETARAVSAAGDESSFFDVASVLRDAQAQASESEGVEIDLVLPEPSPRLSLEGPRTRLLMAFVNLLRNAAQAGGPGVTIRASLQESPGHELVVIFDDSGPGIPEERREGLFQPAPRPTRDGGGHGLALVREVIEEEYGGSVHHEVSPLGGARFVLRMPLPKEIA